MVFKVEALERLRWRKVADHRCSSWNRQHENYDAA